MTIIFILIVSVIYVANLPCSYALNGNLMKFYFSLEIIKKRWTETILSTNQHNLINKFIAQLDMTTYEISWIYEESLLIFNYL